MSVDCMSIESKCRMIPVFKKMLEVREKSKGKSFGKIGPAVFQDITTFLESPEVQTRRDLSGMFKGNPIVSFGDLHGDLLVLLGLLHFAALIDSDGNWKGGNHIVVQLGDFTDRDGRGSTSLPTDNNREEIDIIQYMFYLNLQAQKAGGHVISVLGNHELALLFPGTFPDYKLYWEGNQAAGWGGWHKKQDLFGRGREGLFRRFVENGHVPPILQLGNFVFLHAGLTLQNIKNFDSVKSIQKKFYECLRSEYLESSDITDIFFTRAMSDGSVPENKCIKNVKGIFDKLRIDFRLGGVCVAHTPQETLSKYCGGKIWKMDLAMSEAFGKVGKLGFILIKQQKNDTWVSLHVAHSQANWAACPGTNEVEIKTLTYMNGNVFSAEHVKRVVRVSPPSIQE